MTQLYFRHYDYSISYNDVSKHTAMTIFLFGPTGICYTEIAAVHWALRLWLHRVPIIPC